MGYFKPKTVVKQIQGISMKKCLGQHFLKDERYLDSVFAQVPLASGSSVFEIGGGEGVLTRLILQAPIARLWVFEIDPEWAAFLRKKFSDDRLKVFKQDFLKVDLATFEPHKPWILLANLPYNITFPILYTLAAHRSLLQEGVVMIQEEVAQKLVAQGGRGYGVVSLFFQRAFELKLLDKVPPTAFFPEPKVFSRLVYFKPIANPIEIPHEEKFWAFAKTCFKQPRRTLKNNLQSTTYLVDIPEEFHTMRAQQLTMNKLLELWNGIVRKF